MRTNCAPILVELFLYSYKAKTFSLISGYVDDALSTN